MTIRYLNKGIAATFLLLAIHLHVAAAPDSDNPGTQAQESENYWDWGDPVSADAPSDTGVTEGSAAPSTAESRIRENAVPSPESPEVDVADSDTDQTSLPDTVPTAGNTPRSAPVESGQGAETGGNKSERAGSLATTTEASGTAGGGETDLSDWDWGEIQEASEPPAVTVTRRHKDNKREGPRVGSTAKPDFEREPLPGQPVFADAPAYLVVPSQKDTDMHPCSDCHEWAESDPTPRSLQDPHDNFTLDHGLHGKGKFWCFTCHSLEGDGGLKTLEGVPLGFDDAYMVCAQCHSQETRDWSFGAHGKRVNNWSGERTILNCTVCHYQHRPNIGARAPKPPRPVPSLNHREHNHAPLRVERIWERYARKKSAEASHGP